MRYAIYYAPAADDPLTERAAAWLGRCAFTGAALARPAFPALSDLDLDALTADPRHYGFHGTIRAPFELAQGQSEAALVGFAAGFAAKQGAFSVDLEVAALGRFIAFRPKVASPALHALHDGCMRGFEPFRAPLSEADIARRRRANLSPEQDARMLVWGYPYAFEDFRFHMTLTGSIADDAARARVLAALREQFADLEGPHRFDSIAVYRQESRTADFRILTRCAFAA